MNESFVLWIIEKAKKGISYHEIINNRDRGKLSIANANKCITEAKRRGMYVAMTTPMDGHFFQFDK